MWAEHCSAVRAVKGGTNEPSEYRWCSPCGQLLKDTDACFKLPAAQVGHENSSQTSSGPLPHGPAAADPRVRLSTEEIGAIRISSSVSASPTITTIRKDDLHLVLNQALAALDLQTKLANLDWWCDTCNQRYSGPSDEQCSRASCPKCGHWMVNYQERRNEKAEADLHAAQELLSIHNLGGMTDYNDGPMKRALKAEADLAEANSQRDAESMHASLLFDENNALKADLAAARDLLRLEKIEREALEVKLTNAQQDADRYRWLRNAGPEQGEPSVCIIVWDGHNVPVFETECDAAIDAAKERA